MVSAAEVVPNVARFGADGNTDMLVTEIVVAPAEIAPDVVV